MSTQVETVSLIQTNINGIITCCPRCHGSFEWSDGSYTTLTCIKCHFPMSSEAGVWQALPVERATYYAQFIRDYENIRATEGRGSRSGSYYLSLPSVDRSDRNAQQWKIRAASYNYLKHHVLPAIKTIPKRSTRVLDIGAGNGWFSYRLAQLGFTPVAVDLLTNDMDGLGAAKHYDAHLARPFLRFRAESARLPFCDGQFDAAIFNASFHYSENYAQTLSEALRCLTPEGTIIIVDSPWYSHEESGQQMLVEKRKPFFNRFGIFSDSIRSQEFLTDKRLDQLANIFGLRWERHLPFYGVRWTLRPWIAKLKKRREPSSFRIYVARKRV